MHIPAQHWQSMLAHITRCIPEEACGLLAGLKDEVQAVYPVTNVLHRPDRYEMDPAGQVQAFAGMEARGLELVGIYHSHPHGPAVPSPTDLDESYYPEVVYVIWSPDDPPQIGWQARGFRLRGRWAEEVGLIVDKTK